MTTWSTASSGRNDYRSGAHSSNQRMLNHFKSFTIHKIQHGPSPSYIIIIELPQLHVPHCSIAVQITLGWEYCMIC